MKKIGTLKTNHTKTQELERKTIQFLLDSGFNIELIRPTNTDKNKNPDILFEGKIWEIKTPITDNKDTLERKITKGGRQANNLIIDLRFTKVDETIGKSVLIRRYNRSRRVKNLIIISKSGALERILKNYYNNKR